MSQLVRSSVQLGNVIRRARKNRGWTQSQLADHAGLRQELVSKIETGHESTKLSTIHAIFAALSLDLVVEARNARQTADIEDIF
ncbi:helix-turn-helix domain-containing protein [Sphingomonas sp. FW199]|uniref:helix-turn-helix domain-containing protein n=1 Tax=Sphingomonas sp. FW199 TaxID=3400217 RepID=UPI003CF2CD37